MTRKKDPYADHVCVQRRPRRASDIHGILMDMVILGEALVLVDEPAEQHKHEEREDK